jgi:Tfp pilus assembly protein PilN
MLFGALALASAVGMGAYWWTLSAEANRLEEEIATAQQQVAALKAVIAEGNRHKAERNELAKRVAVVDELTGNQTRAILFMDAVADTIPRDLWITSISEQNQQLQFSGNAASSTALADFMSNLRASGKFKDVDLVVARQDVDKTPRLITFVVAARFET